MADDDVNENTEGGNDDDLLSGGEGDGDGKKKSKKMLILIAGLVTAIVLTLVVLFVMGMFDSSPEEESEASTPASGEKDTVATSPKEDTPLGPDGQPFGVVFHDLPDFLVNLNTGDKRAKFLKVSVTLEIDDPTTLEAVQTHEPRIIDNFQIYLRELRPSDLSGSAGIYRLREELLRRVNETLHPVQINDILFKEMIVQ